MKKDIQRSRSAAFVRCAAALAVAACFGSGTVLGNPTGAVVKAGTATFQQTGNTLQITNSPNAVIHWQGFSISRDEITRFIQQSSSSAVLNRVTGGQPSAILGALQSNGRVFLINPNGILFGAGAQINVAGLVASTLNLTDADFVAGRMRFGATPGAGAVVNDGTIATPAGGQVYLIAPNVQNNGVITSPKGEVVIAAGRTVELADTRSPLLRVEITAPDTEAVNVGKVLAEGGRVSVYGSAIRQKGVINADGVSVGEGGRILLQATKSVSLEKGSVTSASGPTGGKIEIESIGGTTEIAGRVETRGTGIASTPSQVAEQAGVGRGGTIHVLGGAVALAGSAEVDASGNTGGGTVLIGGDFQGRNPLVQNSQYTFVDAGAKIAVDALQSGDGGKTIVWADKVTDFRGAITARGGVLQGNGGFVEVSGKEFLRFRGLVDASAPNGRIGTLLLDPRDIKIDDSSGPDNSQLNANVPAGAPAGSILFADGGTTTYTISDEAIEAQTAHIVLQATDKIEIESGLSGGGLVLTTPGQSITLQAGDRITIKSPVVTRGGNIILEADSPHMGTPNGNGELRIESSLSTLGSGATGGAITLIGGQSDEFRIDATVRAGTGGINVGLSQPAAFGIGTGGGRQLSGSDIGRLKTTGALTLGRVTTGGTDGLGTGAQVLTVDSISHTGTGVMDLAPDSGSTFQLIAGSGGITLGRPLTTYQNTVIDTTGPVAVNRTLGTFNHDLTINAASVALGPFGAINTGSGVFSCTGTGCGALTGSNSIFWDGGGGDLNWFTANNWSTNTVPDATSDVTIGSGFGTISISGAAQAHSLIASSPVQFSSGSLALEHASTFSDALMFTGGTLAGIGDVVIGGANGALAWSGGAMTGAGAFVLSNGRTGTIVNAVSLNRLFQNEGTLNLAATTITGTGSIASTGTVNFNSGTVSVNVPYSSTGVTNIAGATAAINSAASTHTLNLASGALAGTGNVTITGAMTWSGGTQAGTGTTTVEPAATLEISGSPSLAAGRTFDNQSTAAVWSGNGTIDVAGTFNNSGTLTATGDGTIQAVSGVGTFNNSGAFVKSGGTGTTSFVDNFGLTVNNTGSLEIQSGSMNVAATTFTTPGTISIKGTGAATTLNVAGDLNLSPSSVINAELDGTAAGAFGKINVTGTAALNGATLNVSTGGGYVATDGDFFSLVSAGNTTGTFGTINASFGNPFTPHYNPASVVLALGSANVNTWIFDGSDSWSNPARWSLGHAPTGSEQALIDRSAGVFTITVPAGTFGADRLTSNENLTLAGTLGLANASTINAALAINGGTLQGAGSVALNGPLDLNGGTVATTGGLTVAGTTTVSGPASTVSGTLTTNGALNVNGTLLSVAGTGVLNVGGTASIDGAAIWNYGTVTVTGAGGFSTAGDGLVFKNKAGGLLDLQNDGGFVGDDGTFETVLNEGTLRKAVAGGTTAFSNVNLSNNGGTLDVQTGHLVVTGNFDHSGAGSVAAGTVRAANGGSGSGSLALGSGATVKIAGGTMTLAPGTAITGAGVYRVEGATVTVGGSVSADNLDLASGALDGGGNLTVNGAFTWSGGTLAGSGSVAVNGPGATLDLPGTGSRVLDGRIVLAGGNTTLGGGSLHVRSGSLSTSGAFTVGSGALLTAGGGSLDAAGGPIDVLGTLEVAGGAITAGTLNVHAGGVLRGAGTVDANVNNIAGTVLPGASPGVLTIRGSYTQSAAGTLDLDVGGTAPGTQHDVLDVTGNVALGGTLNVSTSSGYTPAAGDTYGVIKAGASSGEFTAVIAPPASKLAPDYIPGGVNVVVRSSDSTPVPTPTVPAAQPQAPSSPAPQQAASATVRAAQEANAIASLVEDASTSGSKETDEKREASEKAEGGSKDSQAGGQKTKKAKPRMCH